MPPHPNNMQISTFVPPLPLTNSAPTQPSLSQFRPVPPGHFAPLQRRPHPPPTPTAHRLSACADGTPDADETEDVASIDELLDRYATADLSPEELQLCEEFPPDIPMINKVVLVGRLGRDPEIKVVGPDLQVCTFSLAVQNEYDPDEGPDQERTSWFDVEAWGRLAQYIVSSSGKGMRVGVTGVFGMNQWTGRDGQVRQNYIVTADSFEVLQSRSERSQSDADAWRQQNRFSQQQPYKQKKKVEEQDQFIDLPF